MNKLVVIVALFTISPVAAMFTGGSSACQPLVVRPEETHTMKSIKITDQENIDFLKHLSMAVTFGEEMITENKISANHPIHSIHKQLSDKLTSCNSNLLQVIVENRKMQISIGQIAKTIEKKSDVQNLRNKIFDEAQLTDQNKMPEIMQIMQELTNVRWQHSELMLSSFQSDYFQSNLNGKNEDEDRVNFINFMLKNEQYPTNEEAEQMYIMTLIYQHILARRIPYELFPGGF